MGAIENEKGKNLERKRGEERPKGKVWGCYEGLERRMGWRGWDKGLRRRGHGTTKKEGEMEEWGVVWGCEEGRGGGHDQGGWMVEVNRSVHLKLVGSSGFTSLITDFGSSTPVKRLPNSNR